jgi:hypothetical protein
MFLWRGPSRSAMGVMVNLYQVAAADLNAFITASKAALEDDDNDDFPEPKAARTFDLHKNWINLLIGLTGEEDPLPGPVTSALFGVRPLFPGVEGFGWHAVFAKDVATVRAALDGATEDEYIARLNERWGAPLPGQEAASREVYLRELRGVRELYAGAQRSGDLVVIRVW